MTKNDLPPGWELSKNREGPDKNCIAYKHLEDFKYAEVRYEPQKISAFGGGFDYALYKVDVEGPGPYVEIRQGSFEDLGKAFRAGDLL